MSTATAKALNLEQEDLFTSSSSSARVPTSASTATLPSFDRFPEIIHAQAARIAGRVNASGISETEHKALLSERQQLLDKQFAETISQKELNRLEYVRWSLDRIEDAKYGDTLDSLEGSVSGYEQLLSELRVLSDQLRNYQEPKKKKK